MLKAFFFASWLKTQLSVLSMDLLRHFHFVLVANKVQILSCFCIKRLSLTNPLFFAVTSKTPVLERLTTWEEFMLKVAIIKKQLTGEFKIVTFLLK